MKTTVQFYHDKDGDVFAYFPFENYDTAGKLQTCYAHIGQHSACDFEYVKECEDARSNEYQFLYDELKGLGYNLEVMDNRPVTYHRQPTEGEVRFGEGAIHYKDFELGTVINPKAKTFALKKWIICPHDGLRYYY